MILRIIQTDDLPVAQKGDFRAFLPERMDDRDLHLDFLFKNGGFG